MKRIIFITLAALTGFTAAAYSVKGIVADAKDTEPLPGALCRIYNCGDTTKVIEQITTDSDGRFESKLPSGGDYILRTEYMGYLTKDMHFVASAQNPDVNLGVVYLSEDAMTLDAVTVTGRRPVIQANGERVTYNLEEDPETQTSTLLEMLRKVPMVTVDGQDNIQVNGQSNFKIYINGKENPMFSANAKDILKAMPASSVKKIEVITEPGAKYDAEGVGGILNIITEGPSTEIDKYTLTVRGELENTSAGGSVYALGQVGKVTASLNYTYNRDFGNRDQDVTIERAMTGENPMTILMEGVQTNSHTFHQGAFDLSWEPNDKNLFNVSANLFLGCGNTPFSMVQTTLDGNGNVLGKINQHQSMKWDWGSWSSSASYQHTFDKAGHNIVTSYLYTHGVNKDYSTMYDSSISSTQPMQINDVRNPTNEHTLQLDYTNPLDSKNTLETGAKAIFRRNSSDGLTTMLNNTVNQEVSLDQYQDVAAVYASHSGTYGKWSTKAGLRYEYTHMGVDFIKGNGGSFSTDLNDVVPNAALSYNFSPMTLVRLSYQMRISRPTVSQLNPYRDDSNPLSVEYGNPELTSERSNNFTFTFSNFGQKMGMNLSATYFLSNNSIGQYSYAEAGKIYTTYANTGRNQTVGFNAYLMFNFFKKFTWTVNGSLQYKDFDFKEMGLRNHGWGTSAYVNLNYTMPADIRLTAYGGIMKQGVQLQADGMGAIKFYALSLSKYFLNDRLQLTASASNFFGPLKVKMNSWTSDSYTRIAVNVPISSFGISLSYRFGGGVSDVKKVSNSIENDDIQKTSGGSTISGN